MSTKLINAAVVTGVVGALIATGATTACAVPSSATAASGRHTLTYTIGSNQEITGPRHIDAGYVNIYIAGGKKESFQLARARGTSTAHTLIKDVNTLNNSGKANDLDKDFGCVGGASGHNSLYLKLKPGKYFAIDTAVQKPTTADVLVILVGKTVRNAVAPKIGATITAIHHMTWGKNPAEIPTSGYLKFMDKATDNHFVELDKLKPGKTVADVKKVFKGKENPKDVFATGPETEFDSAVLSPGHAFATTYSLKAGHYVLLCFWPDKKTGVPHALMGMLRGINVG